jgi:hypothetical protein
MAIVVAEPQNRLRGHRGAAQRALRLCVVVVYLLVTGREKNHWLPAGSCTPPTRPYG